MMEWKEIAIIALAIISALVIRKQAYEEGYRDGLKNLSDKVEKAERLYYSFISHNIQKGKKND